MRPGQAGSDDPPCREPSPAGDATAHIAPTRSSIRTRQSCTELGQGAPDSHQTGPSPTQGKPAMEQGFVFFD
ncbi:hypothetical protein HNR07_004819 [Nocardiopsis metallicus]|uniref:Uncharacterized protein n=1 Tax=Nocardiopsis metallicus TaxID=179819 RepID=A0A840WC02_9ACTN|nr:hypothetical protein [Nocardiopsis metallicus]